MAFFARTFIFNDIPSETYGLYLGVAGDSGESTNAVGTDVTLLTQKIYRRPVPLYYGAEQTPVLQFPLSMYSPNEMTAADFSDTATWLFGQMAYKKLRICQNDMQDIYFNCFLTAPQIVRYGNLIKMITTTVICDAPWGWGEPGVYTYNFNPNEYAPLFNARIDNISDDNFYTYPTNLIIKANLFGGAVTITNIEDNNRQFILSLSPNETVTLNCDLQTISSDATLYPLANFNLNFLRLIQGTNNLIIEGNVKEITMNVPTAIKIGG
jgi:phage-related protein